VVGSWLAGTGTVGAACWKGGRTARQKSTLYVWLISMAQRQRGQRAIMGGGGLLGFIGRTAPLSVVGDLCERLQHPQIEHREMAHHDVTPNAGCELIEIWPGAN